MPGALIRVVAAIGICRAARSYGPTSLQGMRHAELLEFLRTVGCPDKGVLLDVGCGRGELLVACRGLGMRLQGCDWLETCPSEGEFEYRRVDLNRDGLRSYADGSIDVVLCSDVLEHMENPAWTLREIRRVLKVGGVAAVSIPNSWNILERLRFLVTGNFRRYRSERVSGAWGHISFLTRDILESLCDRARLQIVRVTGGARRGHMAIGGYYVVTPPSTLLSYNVYFYLQRTTD